MNKPYISPDFSIEDIHKIREYHHEQTKDMTFEEKIAFYKKGADEFESLIIQKRKEKELATY